MENVIRPSLPDPDAAQPRRSLVARVYDALKRPDVRVEQFKLRKALMADDRDAIVKSARHLTGEQRLEVLEQVDEIRKSGAALPADQSRAVGWTAAYRLPRNWNWNLPHADPNLLNAPAPTPAPKPSIALAPQEGTGMRHAVQRGAIVHFDIDGQRYHGKVLKWGQRGITAVTADGEVAAVTWADVRWGVAPESAAEHVAKSVSLDLYAMTPEQRAAYFKMRGDDIG